MSFMGVMIRELTNMQRLQKMIPKKELGAYTGGLKRTAIEDLVKRGEFPKPVRLSERRLAWIESELVAWQQERIARRDAIGSGK
jgi:prophage regulatory protein